jgi:selenide,water dikinase
MILTKPLGTGIVTTALKHRRVSRATVNAAVASMVALNREASRVLRALPVHACSDVTGFGLLGHATEMAMGSGVTIVLESAALPLLEGALKLAERGFLTGGCKRNRAYLEGKVLVERSVGAALQEIAFDPQTSGGLLIALPSASSRKLMQNLRKAGIKGVVVGHATEREEAWVRLE